MKDYPRFVLRGAAAGAAVEFSAVIYIWGPFAIAIFFSPLALVHMVLPGAVVGLAVCAVAGQTPNPLAPAKRFGVGAGVVAVLFSAETIYSLASDELAREHGFEIWVIVLRVLVFAGSVGGLAGLACPASREYARNESELSYRERTCLYEAAEQEAKEARERNTLSTSIGNQAR